MQRLPDTIDVASELAERERSQLVAEIRSKLATPPTKHEHCQNCGEVLPNLGIYCNSDCADDAEKRNAAFRRTGVRVR